MTALLALGWWCTAPASSFADLPPQVRGEVDLRLTRRSTEVAASPFATLTSFEVHGESEDEAVIETMAALGVKHVVMHNIPMCLADPDDRRLNAWLDACEREGIEVRCILVSRDTAFWRTALANYGHRIRHWSFLNEPNAPGPDHDHSKPHVRPEAYVAELRAVRDVVRDVAPGCRLWGPELAMLQAIEEWPWPWFRLACEAGLLEAVDGISFHPYRQGYSPENTPEKPSTFEGRPTARYATYEEQIATLRELTRHKPLAIYEVGWSTTPEGPITELTQAKFALRQQIQDFALGIECAVWFLIRERHVDAPYPAGHLENHFGIVRVDNSPKPAYTALQTLYSQLHDGCIRAYPDVRFGRDGVKWYVFDDFAGAVPSRKLLYWLPIPASDDCPDQPMEVVVGDVVVPSVPVSDAPRMLRLHHLEGRWGWPVLVDLLKQEARTDIGWATADGG